MWFTLLGFAAWGTFLVTPRPTQPRFLPLPVPAKELLAERDQRERDLAKHALSTGLPQRARIIGEEFRRVGAALQSQSPDTERLLRELQTDARRLLHAGGESELLALRALQAELFVRAVHHSLLTPGPHPDLDELGAQFAEQLERYWLTGQNQLRLSDAELRLLFRLRWGLLTGLQTSPAFAALPEERSRFHSLYLQIPWGQTHTDERELLQLQLRAVQSLAQLDPSYPAQLAQGILLLRAQEPEGAVESLRAHLQENPQGPWAQLCKNYLASALRKAAPF